MFNSRLKQQLAELQDEVATSRQIRESLYSEMLVIELETDGQIRFANDNMLQALGYSLEQLLGRRIE